MHKWHNNRKMKRKKQEEEERERREEENVFQKLLFLTCDSNKKEWIKRLFFKSVFGIFFSVFP